MCIILLIIIVLLLLLLLRYIRLVRRDIVESTHIINKTITTNANNIIKDLRDQKQAISSLDRRTNYIASKLSNINTKANIKLKSACIKQK